MMEDYKISYQADWDSVPSGISIIVYSIELLSIPLSFLHSIYRVSSVWSPQKSLGKNFM